MATEQRGASHLALRARITITFALVTLAATLFVSASTFILARQYLIEQRERSSIRQTFLNARLARDLLESGEKEPQAVLDSTVGEVGTLALLRVDGQWYASGVAADPNDLPASLTAALDDGVAAHQRVVRAGRPRLLVGVPLGRTDTQYLEIVPLEALQRTFRTLIISLLIGSAGTSVAGTFIGMYVSRRVLRPLTRMSTVAAGITAGDTKARLDAQGDRDLVSLVDSFNEMVDSLQARIEREQRFASDVSHEMRTPLTVLKAAVQLVERRATDLPPRALEAVHLMSRQVSYFERLVLDLLEISRFDSGVEQPELEETDLVEFVNSISLDLGGPAADVQQASVATDPISTGDVSTGAGSAGRVPAGAPAAAEESALPSVRLGVDRRRMERILRNLIENANRYAGGVSRLGVSVTERWIRIEVDDDGDGVPADERERIFERFWRGREARHHESKGSGLGLALVTEHVRVLGGRIFVDESSTGGARFVVELPRKEGW